MLHKRIFTLTRIVALMVIAVVVLGLSYVRFAPGAQRVSVPSGAKAGDLTLHGCTYTTEQGSMPADCGTLVVPENRSDRRSRLIALPVTRIRSRSSHAQEPIFRFEGGPGLTNMTFPQASRYVDHRDLVLVGYRGVDGSSRLDCPEVVSAAKHAPDLVAATALHARATAFKRCADRLQRHGVDLAGYTLAQRVDDMETARKALGYGRVDLISESAGTRAAMIYAWRYPASIRRSIMVAVNPPGNYVWDPDTTDAQIEHYSQLCAQDAGCRNHTRNLAASMRATAADLPDHWMGLPIAKGNVALASFFGFMNSTTEAAPLTGPMTVDSWQRAARGDASGLWFESLLTRVAFPEAQVWGDAASIAREDADAARASFASAGADHSILGDAGTKFLWAGGGLVDAWPDAPDSHLYSHVQRSDVETLLVGGNLDFATPANFATDQLLPALSHGHQVILSDLGHTDDFWGTQKAAGTHLITSFYDRGNVDDSQYRHESVDFKRSPTQGVIAQIMLTVMVGVALLAVLWLAVLAIRVGRRGGTGRKTGAWIRTVGPAVFGLGGWFLGALLVLKFLPSRPLDDQLLAVLSIALPIWLGVYAGWLRPDTARAMRAKGFGYALGGALVGAWLGFGVTPGLMALVTAIAGATAASNLALLVLDIRTERAARAVWRNPVGTDTVYDTTPPSSVDQLASILH